MLLARGIKASDMRDKVKVYEQVNVSVDGRTVQEWKYKFSIWCRERTIFREQLETVVSGAETLRNRLEMETRYPTKLNTRHRVVFNNEMYRVSIVGDTDGTHDTVRFLAKSLEDGGA